MFICYLVVIGTGPVYLLAMGCAMAEHDGTTRAFLRNNSMSLVFGGLFLLALGGQALAGWAAYDDEQVVEGLRRVSLSWYVTSADFVVDASANSQSEFLQFSLYMVGTVWLPQRGGAVIQASGNQQVVLEHGRPEHLEDPRVGPSPCR